MHEEDSEIVAAASLYPQRLETLRNTNAMLVVQGLYKNTYTFDCI
jgi:hypothetical protein